MTLLYALAARLGCFLLDIADRSPAADALAAEAKAAVELQTVAPEPTPIGDAAYREAIRKTLETELAVDDFAALLDAIESPADITYLLGEDQ